MPLNRFHARSGVLALLLALTAASPALARPGGWGGDSWRDDGWGGGRDSWDSPSYRSSRTRHAEGPPEGHVVVARFTAEGDAASALGHGVVTVTGAPTGSGVESRELATYEAAVIDQLTQVGYRTDSPPEAATQIAELHISHDVVVPQEGKRSPVTGEMAVGVSNRGSMVGMAVNVDLTKPRAALIATRLEARIHDKATSAVLWEARADINTREGDEKWTDGAIAARLASALFDHFPGTSGNGPQYP